MKIENLTPLFRGALALRFLVEWSALPGIEPAAGRARPKVVGIQVVEVVAVDGNRVIWTNHLPTKFFPGRPQTHTCDRRELIALDALEYLPAVEDEKSADPSELAGASTG